MAVKTEALLKKLEGVQTVQSVMLLLKVSRKKAIQLVYQLRKKGYVKTGRRSDGTRVYSISFENRMKGTSYYDIINKHSPFKVAASEVYTVHGRRPSLEEALVFAVKTRSLRTIIASLALFQKIEEWSRLYRFAKQARILRHIGALYDVSRRIMRTRKMTKRFRNNSLPKKNDKFEYLVDKLKSNDFPDIEKKWKIYVPFNMGDLEGYK